MILGAVEVKRLLGVAQRATRTLLKAVQETEVQVRMRLPGPIAECVEQPQGAAQMAVRLAMAAELGVGEADPPVRVGLPDPVSQPSGGGQPGVEHRGRVMPLSAPVQ